MKSNNDRTQAAKAAKPPQSGRFRIDKLEERIAPKGWGKGGKPRSLLSCCHGPGASCGS